MNSRKLDSLLQKVINYSFYSLFFFVPFLFYTGNSELFEFNKMVATYALTAVITGAWVGRCVLHGKFLFTKTVLDIPLLLFLLSLLLSTLFSIDHHTSIWGYYSRSNGGLLSILSYLLLYWAYVSNVEKEDVKLHIKALFGSSLIISIYAILEHFGYSFSCVLIKDEFSTNCWVQDVQNRIFATLGQPNWLAAWLVAIAPLAWTLDNLKIKLGASSAIFAAVLFTKSRSGLLGFAAAFGVYWFFNLLKSRNFKSLSLLVASHLLLIAVFQTPWSPKFSDVLAHLSARSPQTTINQEPSLRSNVFTMNQSGTVLETGGTESFAIRQIVWKGALDVWRAYPLFGSGVETFAYSYYQYRPKEHNQTSEWDFLYNKAHNEYLNYLATTGIFGLTTYLLILIVIIINAIVELMKRGAQHPLLAALFSGYIGILITNYAGFSVVPTATLFYLFPAMAFVLVQRTKDKGQRTNLLPLSFKSRLYLSFVLCTMLFVLLKVLNIWRADTFYAAADRLTRRGLPHYAAEPFGDAITLRPDEPLYYSKYAGAAAQIAATLAEENEATKAAEIAKDADDLQTKALSISPRNIPIIKDAHTNYIMLAGIDDKYLQKSHQLIEYLLKLSPTDPRVFSLLGQSYLRIGQKEKAIETLNYALELKPDFPDPKEILVQLETND